MDVESVEREIHSNQCQCLPTHPHWALATWAALSPSTSHVKVMSPMTVVVKPELGSHKTKCSEITKVQQILCCSAKLKLGLTAAVTLILKMTRTAMNTCTPHSNPEKNTVNFSLKLACEVTTPPWLPEQTLLSHSSVYDAFTDKYCWVSSVWW